MKAENLWLPLISKITRLCKKKKTTTPLYILVQFLLLFFCPCFSARNELFGLVKKLSTICVRAIKDIPYLNYFFGSFNYRYELVKCYLGTYNIHWIQYLTIQLGPVSPLSEMGNHCFSRHSILTFTSLASMERRAYGYKSLWSLNRSP